MSGLDDWLQARWGFDYEKINLVYLIIGAIILIVACILLFEVKGAVGYTIGGLLAFFGLTIFLPAALTLRRFAANRIYDLMEKRQNEKDLILKNPRYREALSSYDADFWKMKVCIYEPSETHKDRSVCKNISMREFVDTYVKNKKWQDIRIKESYNSRIKLREYLAYNRNEPLCYIPELDELVYEDFSREMMKELRAINEVKSISNRMKTDPFLTKYMIVYDGKSIEKIQVKKALTDLTNRAITDDVMTWANIAIINGRNSQHQYMEVSCMRYVRDRVTSASNVPLVYFKKQRKLATVWMIPYLINDNTFLGRKLSMDEQILVQDAFKVITRDMNFE